MDNIRIQDDLYNFVNHEKLEQLVIPDDMPVAGGFAELNTDVEKLMLNEFEQMSKSGEYPNIHLNRAVALYKAVKNVRKRNANGIKPALKKYAKIEKLQDVNAFNRALKDLVLGNFPLPFSISVEADMKDTLHHCVTIQGPSVILPDVSYYRDEMAQQRDAILGIWTNMAKMIMSKTNLCPEDQDKYIQDTLAFDSILSKLVKSNEEWSEYVKAYNPYKTSRVSSLLKPVKFRRLLNNLFGFVPEKIIVAEPRYFKSFNEVFNENTFELYKHWAYVKGIVGSCSFLSEELRAIGSIYRNALSGIAAVAPLDKFAYQLASSLYSEPVGLYYGEKYFGEEAKKDIVSIVREIVDTYKSRIEKNEFLEDSTKQKAILKLSKMEVKMGYPDAINEVYDRLDFNEKGNLFDIVGSLRKALTIASFEKLAKDVDRSEWVMPGHMVNACYNPSVNDITFPAAILQAPFYSLKQTRSENLGGIGAVIGHEISHAFDSNGAKCDENGNLNNWWTKNDTRKFESKIKAMVKEFDGIELPWGIVNGKFIVSENIADNGGMAVTLDIMSRMQDKSYEEYFMNWARVWCAKAKPEYQQLLLKVDVHGPAILRANMQPRNFPEWYDTFNVTKNDKMYIAPNKRVIIW